jgi:hypothetical protein
MTEISSCYDLRNPYQDCDLYAPEANECRGPDPEELTSHAPESPRDAAPGTAELTGDRTALDRATSRAAEPRESAELGSPDVLKACNLAASLFGPVPLAKAAGLLGCAMLFDPAPDAAPAQVDNARGASGTGGRDYAPPSGTGGVRGK